MTEYLLFRLYGILASWGDIAVGEVRPSANHPSRSQLLGLLSAALGIRRTESDKLSLLFEGYDIAVKMVHQGTLLRDYHTIQVPKSGKITYLTRKEELSDRKSLSTILSSREYYCDSEVVVSVRSRKGAPYTLSDLQTALQFPKFVLYIGRKSCPLSLPVLPQIVQSKGFKESFSKAVWSDTIKVQCQNCRKCKENGNEKVRSKIQRGSTEAVGRHRAQESMRTA